MIREGQGRDWGLLDWDLGDPGGADRVWGSESRVRTGVRGRQRVRSQGKTGSECAGARVEVGQGCLDPGSGPQSPLSLPHSLAVRWTRGLEHGRRLRVHRAPGVPLPGRSRPSRLVGRCRPGLQSAAHPTPRPPSAPPLF